MQKRILLYLLSAFYILAGLSHFFFISFYETIMPPYLPAHRALIFLSGFAEIFFGVFLIPESTRQTSAWFIIILLIAVFPANVQMMVNYHNRQDPLLWLAILRLPLQVVLIMWAKAYTKQVNAFD